VREWRLAVHHVGACPLEQLARLSAEADVDDLVVGSVRDRHRR
jgi:hypothetical protein